MDVENIGMWSICIFTFCWVMLSDYLFGLVLGIGYFTFKIVTELEGDRRCEREYEKDLKVEEERTKKNSIESYDDWKDEKEEVLEESPDEVNLDINEKSIFD